MEEVTNRKRAKKNRSFTSNKNKFLIIIFIIIVLVIAVYIIFDYSIRPVIGAVAEAKIRGIAAQAMNDAILKNLDGDLTYNELITVLESEGRVYMLQANVAKMNQISSTTAMTAQNSIASIGEQGLRIPLGTLIGSQIFSGQGPIVELKVTPVGSVVSEFISEFKEAGINQTLHTVKLRLETSVQVVLPGGGRTVTVQVEAPIAESVIVGDVPQVYLSSQSLPG